MLDLLCGQPVSSSLAQKKSLSQSAGQQNLRSVKGICLRYQSQGNGAHGYDKNEQTAVEGRSCKL